MMSEMVSIFKNIFSIEVHDCDCSSGSAFIEMTSRSTIMDLDSKNIFENEQSFAVVKDGALLEIFSKEGFLVHSLKKILDYKPVNAFSDELIQSQLASKAIAFDHLTYMLLTQNRWLSP
mgnify:CR=1 FL=1